MPKGLKLPVGVDATGGLAIVESEEQNQNVIFSALSDCDNDNAFQQALGIGASMIFDLQDERVRARIINRVLDVFDSFEAQHRFKLRTETVRWTEDGENGELTLEFMYHDLESDEEKPFARNFQSTK